MKLQFTNTTDTQFAINRMIANNIDLTADEDDFIVVVENQNDHQLALDLVHGMSFEFLDV